MFIFKEDCEKRTGESKQEKFRAAMKKIFEVCMFIKSVDEKEPLSTPKGSLNLCPKVY